MRKPLWTYLACCIAVFMISMDNLIVTNALPVIRQALHTGLEGLEWTVNAYTMTFAVLLLTGAALGDRFGRRRLLIIGVTVFTAGSAASALAPGIGVLIAARAVQGVGAAIVTPLTVTLIASVTPPQRRGMALGLGRHRAGHRRARLGLLRHRRPGQPWPVHHRPDRRPHRLRGHTRSKRAGDPAGPGDPDGPAGRRRLDGSAVTASIGNAA